MSAPPSGHDRVDVPGQMLGYFDGKDKLRNGFATGNKLLRSDEVLQN
jgi:hypothetical protein